MRRHLTLDKLGALDSKLEPAIPVDDKRDSG
jgi:hypothetical protein